MKFDENELEKELKVLKDNHWLNKDFNEKDFFNKIINLEFTSPNKKDVFNAFKLFKSEETRILIIGQDPYPDSNKAQGLAFSCKKGKAHSLTKIFSAISKYTKHSTKNFNYDLTNWATENKICLLNAALTFEKSSLYKYEQKKNLSKNQQKELEKDQQIIQKKHIEAWNYFIICVMEKLIKENIDLVVFLWGDKAKQLFEKCTGYKTIKHIFLTSHPRRRLKQGEIDKFLEEAPVHFKACDEFLGKNKERKYTWLNFPDDNQ